jgi:glycosyltransferase involved in cell wall biosynthesis
VRITYVLPRPELNGGNKVISQHAELLASAGHDVLVLGDGPRPEWFPAALSYRELASVSSLPSQDLVIATFWTTVTIAEGLRAGPVAHFCQGFEADLPHNARECAQIEAAYSRPGPLLAISPHLTERLGARFARPARTVPPPLDRLFRPRLRLGPHRHPAVVVAGIFESEVKDVPTAIAAVRCLRDRGVPARLVRLSTWPPGESERLLLEPDEYHHAVPADAVAKTLRNADLLLFTSRAGEGFGLPLLEALASGLPAVASRIPSTEAMSAGGEGAIELVAPGDVPGFAASARSLLGSRRSWREARRRGLRLAERFAPEAIAPLLLDAVEWAARQPTPQPELAMASRAARTV